MHIYIILYISILSRQVDISFTAKEFVYFIGFHDLLVSIVTVRLYFHMDVLYVFGKPFETCRILMCYVPFSNHLRVFICTYICSFLLVNACLRMYLVRLACELVLFLCVHMNSYLWYMADLNKCTQSLRIQYLLYDIYFQIYYNAIFEM